MQHEFVELTIQKPENIQDAISGDGFVDNIDNHAIVYLDWRQDPIERTRCIWLW